MDCPSCGDPLTRLPCPRCGPGPAAPASLLTAGQQQNRVRTGAVPLHRSGYALAATYAGVMTLLVPFLVPITLVLCALAVRDLRRDPGLEGRTRTIFALCTCGIAIVVMLVFYGLHGGA